MLLISFSFQNWDRGYLSVRWNDEHLCARVQAAHRLEARQAKRQDEPPVDVFPKCAHFESPRQEEHCSTPAEPWNSWPSSSVVHGRWPPCTGTLPRAGTLFGFGDSHECRRPILPARSPGLPRILKILSNAAVVKSQEDSVYSSFSLFCVLTRPALGRRAVGTTEESASNAWNPSVSPFVPAV